MLDPGKITLCWPNRIDEAALTGGSFETELPLSLVQERVLAVRAQSVDASHAATWFDVALPQVRPVQVVALARHNLSATAECRVRLYADAAQSVLLWDSGQRAAWPSVYATAQLEWEYDNYWAGTLDEEARELYTPLLTVFSDDVQLARSVRVELFDQGNPDGCLRLGRVIVADAWQPEYNAAYGIAHGFDNADTIAEAGDRTEYFERKRQRRTMALSLEHLSETEAYQRLYGLQRTEGVAGEILYAFGLAERPENFVRTFLARQRQLDPLEHPYHATHTQSLNLLEIL
ncbi:hypothetical protein [Halomonas smyrnensis]|uniref:hypothetical protein n=1 Tax=Halomonas smyrnensis TaxID=720605 RepID=UPI0002D5CBFA|nr:hypothetical protein [Halomonas smyrnensis]